MFYRIVAERPQDAALIEPLLDRTFGTDRFDKTVYRLREGLAPVAALCFSAVDENEALLASLRFWPVACDFGPALLLGPLAVEPALQGRGIGRALVHHGMERAHALGWKLCFVVGAPDYYRPYGFVAAPALGFRLPGWVELERFQVAEMTPETITGPGGLIRRAAS